MATIPKNSQFSKDNIVIIITSDKKTWNFNRHFSYRVIKETMTKLLTNWSIAIQFEANI